MPGALAGWDALIKKYGKTLAEVLEPAIRLAENGFPVSPIIAQDWAPQVSKLSRDPAPRTRSSWTAGARPKRASGSRTPSWPTRSGRRSRDGIGRSTRGPLGRKIVDHPKGMGGFLTYDDMTKVRGGVGGSVGVRFHEYEGVRAASAGAGNRGPADAPSAGALTSSRWGTTRPSTCTHCRKRRRSRVRGSGRAHRRSSGDARVRAASCSLTSIIDARRKLLDPKHAAGARARQQPLTRKRDDLSGRSRRRRQYDLLHQQPVRLLRVRRRGSGTASRFRNRGSGFTMEENHPNMVAPGSGLHDARARVPRPASATGEEPWMALGVMEWSPCSRRATSRSSLNMAVFFEWTRRRMTPPASSTAAADAFPSGAHHHRSAIS